jgi:hypothetical protein
LTNLTDLYLRDNQLTNLTLPPGLTSLTTIDLSYNRLTDFTFLRDLGNLTTLDLLYNQLTSLTLPVALTNLTELYLRDNPLQRLVMPEPLAIGALAVTVADLSGRGVFVFAYPLAISLGVRPWTVPGTFECSLNGPPGNYLIQVTPDLSAWTDIGPADNETGSVLITDPSANSRPRGFYRAVRSN